MDRLDAVKKLIDEDKAKTKTAEISEKKLPSVKSRQKIDKKNKNITAYSTDRLTNKSIESMISSGYSPTMKIGDLWVRPGLYSINGTMAVPGGANFTVHSNGATSATLVLYHRKAEKPFAVIPFPDNYRIGYTYSIIVFGIDVEEVEYTYRLDGPYDPSKGLLFDKKNDLLDPYAMAVVGQSHWGEDNVNNGGYRARIVYDDYDWKDSRFPRIPMQDSIIYEMHVRGFTMNRSSGVQYPGTFAGLIEKIPYLKELGVTAVELMPIMEFDETINSRDYNGRKLYEYWGYNTVSFFAPNTSYAASHEFNYEGRELKNMIRILHENNIEVIMDVVFNHTAEGNENGPTINFKGFGNNISYLIDSHGKYYNFSGCGNTFNCNHPLIQRYILECLRYWVTAYRIDGFRFDLASILGRNRDGTPMDNPPLIENLADDPILGKIKLIAEAWDAGGMYQVGHFPAYRRWAEWNGSYRDCLRSYLKGDFSNAKETADRITGSPDLYHGVYEGYTSSVNFLTCHDGFTLNDLYSYNEKHNEVNGWDNTDGTNDNRSWNCGVEGQTEDPEILALRLKMMRNAITVLMCSRGTPMIFSGDEFCNTQYGNNNTYCQDNEISWLDWADKEKNKSFFNFYRKMIRFRKRHPVISRKMLPTACGLPDVQTSGADTRYPYIDSNTSTLCVLFSGRLHEDAPDDAVFMIINAHWETHEIILPVLPDGYTWQLVVNTDDCEHSCYYDKPVQFDNRGKTYVNPRSVLVFTLLQN